MGEVVFIYKRKLFFYSIFVFGFVSRFVFNNLIWVSWVRFFINFF